MPTIKESAETLLGLLEMTNGPAVNQKDAQKLWDASKEERGFVAVKNFLKAAASIEPTDQLHFNTRSEEADH